MMRKVRFLSKSNMKQTIALAFVGICLLGMSGEIFAVSASAGFTLSSIAASSGKSIYMASRIIMNIGLIAGIVFIFASFFKFHQHKLNPTQIPISQGITLLLIGAALTLFPLLVPTMTHAIFGSSSSAGVQKLNSSAFADIIGTGAISSN